MNRLVNTKTDASLLSQFSSEIRILTPSGRQKWLRLSSRPNVIEPGQSAVWSGFMLDITQAKQLEDEFEADNLDGDVEPLEPDQIIEVVRDQEVRDVLAAANQTMADQIKDETDKLLDTVLYITSMKMKNGFNRSDN
mgnify:CR=1 FL=1